MFQSAGFLHERFVLLNLTFQFVQAPVCSIADNPSHIRF
jgi:hypothetical protein